MDRMIFFSIIIPAYNIEKYILRCLKSVDIQTYTNYEVVIVNDGSNDNTKSIIESFIKDRKKYKLISQNNKGLSCARNAGMCSSSGEYIVFLDGDDELEPDMLEVIAEEIKRNTLDAIFFDAKIFNENGIQDLVESANYYRPDISNRLQKGEDLFIEFMSKQKMLVCACFFAFNRKIIEKNNLYFYPGIIHEDCLFTLKLLLNCKRVKHISNQFYRYYINSNSIMTTKNNYKEAINYGIVTRELIEYYKMAGLSKRGKEYYEKYCNMMYLMGHDSYKKLTNPDYDIKKLYRTLRMKKCKMKIMNLISIRHKESNCIGY